MPNASLTERGLIAVLAGCPKLHLVLYFCRQLEDAALDTIAMIHPNLIRFPLCSVKPQTPEYLTLGPLDTGFGAIVHHCKGSWRLSFSGILADWVFYYIAAHTKKLEILSIAFVRNSDLGFH
ncbi:hypothetical protein P3S68_015161 [Capsicum galapagoense]